MNYLQFHPLHERQEEDIPLHLGCCMLFRTITCHIFTFETVTWRKKSWKLEFLIRERWDLLQLRGRRRRIYDPAAQQFDHSGGILVSTLHTAYICYVYMLKISAKSLHSRLVQRTLLYPRITVINGLFHCAHSLFFPTINPGLLSSTKV